MTFKEFKIILQHNGLGDVLTDESYNIDYAHEISFTVKEIRELGNMIRESGRFKKLLKVDKDISCHLKQLAERLN